MLSSTFQIVAAERTGGLVDRGVEVFLVDSSTELDLMTAVDARKILVNHHDIGEILARLLHRHVIFFRKT